MKRTLGCFKSFCVITRFTFVNNSDSCSIKLFVQWFEWAISNFNKLLRVLNVEWTFAKTVLSLIHQVLFCVIKTFCEFGNTVPITSELNVWPFSIFITNNGWITCWSWHLVYTLVRYYRSDWEFFIYDDWWCQINTW